MDRINGINTVDIGGGRRGWRKQNKAAGISGTEWTEVFQNDLQEELLHLIEAAGFAPAAGVQTQVYDAINHLIGSSVFSWQIYGNSATPVVPAFASRCEYELWGAGGGGGGTGVGSAALGSGGGGGEYRTGTITGLVPGSTLTIGIGAGGIGGLGSGTAGNGTAGGDSIIGLTVRAKGGGPGIGAASGAAATSGSGGNGGFGGNGIAGTGGELPFMAGSVYFGAPGGGSFGCGPGFWGVSYGPSLPAVNGLYPGQGGGGGVNGGPGGAGANGYCKIRWLP